MSENGGLVAVATTDVVELHPSEGKCLFDGIDYTCKAVGDMNDLCHTAESHEQLDAQTNGCNGMESCENGYTDSGISNSADMDICSMELLDDSEANDEGCSTVYEENQTNFATEQDEMSDLSKVEDVCINNTKTDDVADSLCSASKANGDDAVETALNEDPSAGNDTIHQDICNDTSAECSHDACDVSNDILPADTADDSVQSNEHLDKSAGDDGVLDVKVDGSTCHSDVAEVSPSQAHDSIEICPNSTEVVPGEVVHLPAEKPQSEVNAVETSENAVVTSAAASSQPQSQPTYTTSRSVPRPPQHSRLRMGSYGSPPPSSSCPDDDDASKQQYVVNVHVNPGETFSVCVSDQVQLIQGTYRMRTCPHMHSFMSGHSFLHWLVAASVRKCTSSS